MASYAGSAAPALKAWDKKRGKATLLDSAIGAVQQFAVPVAVVAFLVQRYIQHRKKQPKASPPAATKDAGAAAPARKPRRDYKVKRDQEGPLLLGMDGLADGSAVQPHDDVMEAYHEDEVEEAGTAAAAGRGNNAMLQMLQQMGYRIIMPKDGSGQVFLVPPGAQGPDEDGNADGEGDGDEDEDYEEIDGQ